MGTPELIIILIVVLVVFGGTFATRLPKIARSIGQSSNEFKKGLKEDSDEEANARDAK